LLRIRNLIRVDGTLCLRYEHVTLNYYENQKLVLFLRAKAILIV